MSAEECPQCGSTEPGEARYPCVGGTPGTLVHQWHIRAEPVGTLPDDEAALSPRAEGIMQQWRKEQQRPPLAMAPGIDDTALSAEQDARASAVFHAATALRGGEGHQPVNARDVTEVACYIETGLLHPASLRFPEENTEPDSEGEG